MGSPVLEVVWSRGQGSLSVVTDDTISVLSERIMHHATCGALFILQQSNTSVCVIYNKTTSPHSQKPTMKVSIILTLIMTQNTMILLVVIINLGL